MQFCVLLEPILFNLKQLVAERYNIFTVYTGELGDKFALLPRKTCILGTAASEHKF